MRKLIELTVVFLLGWALALYFLNEKENQGINPNTNHTSKLNSNHSTTPDTDHSITSYSLLSQSPTSNESNVIRHTAEIDRAKQQLARGEVELFMESLQKLRADSNESLWQEYRTAFFNELQQLKNKKQYPTAIEWLTTYLRTEYDDVLALQALADFHYLQSNYLAAIDTLYLAKSYAHDNTAINQIVTTQRALTAEYASSLQNKEDNLALLDLYQRLVSVEPEYSAHYVGLAQAYLALGNEADARQTLNIIAYDPEAGAKASQLLSLIENQANQPTTDAEPITLSRHGNNLLTNVLFNNQTYGRLLLDTGASLTVISPELLQELSLDVRAPLRKAWFNTANGVVEAPIFMIQRLSLGGQTVDQIEVAVMNLNNQNINGLLGMNFLQHFRFSIDHQNNVLYLSPRS